MNWDRQAYLEFSSQQAATAAKHKIDEFGAGQQYAKKHTVTYSNPNVNPFRTLPKDAPLRNPKDGQAARAPSGNYSNDNNNSRGNFGGNFRGRGAGFTPRGGMNNNMGNNNFNRNFSSPGMNNMAGGNFNSQMGGFNNQMGGQFGGFNNRGGMMGNMRGGNNMRGGRGGMNGMMGGMPMGGMPMGGMPGGMGGMPMNMGQMGGMPGTSLSLCEREIVSLLTILQVEASICNPISILHSLARTKPPVVTGKTLTVQRDLVVNRFHAGSKDCR